MKANINAYVGEIRGDRAGDRSEKITVTADYESASILSSVTFEVLISEAPKFFIGQKIHIVVTD